MKVRAVDSLPTSSTSQDGKGSSWKFISGLLMLGAVLGTAGIVVSKHNNNRDLQEPTRSTRQLAIEEDVCKVYVDAANVQEMITPQDIFANTTMAFPPGFVW